MPPEDFFSLSSECVLESGLSSPLMYPRLRGVMVRGDFFPYEKDTWCSRKRLRRRQNITYARIAHEHAVSDRLYKVAKRRERSLEERAFNHFEEVRSELQATADYFSMAQSFLQTIDNHLDTDFVKLIEDILVFLILLMRARAKADIMIALLVFVKLRNTKSLAEEALESLTLLVDTLFTDEPQVQSLEDNVTSFRDMMGKWAEMKDTLLGRKYLKLVKYLTSYGVFSCVGIKPTVANLKRAEELSLVNHADFLLSLVDTLSFTLQRALLYSRTGEWDVFLHGPKTYGDWYDKCLSIKRTSYSIGNLDAMGTSYFKFTAQLDECIQEGESIVKFASRDLKVELRAAKQMLHEILLIKATVMTKKSAQQERRAPFALLLHGESSVAKSMFQKMLFFYYGKLMDLPTTDDYKFTRNPADPFWSGFSSQAWCILLDDVGFLNPTKTMIDPSVIELIALVNNVPLVPNQADLADKGKTPVRARLVIASSNTKTLNASAYFACPLAVQRRLPWVITVSPRPDFERADAKGMINPEEMTAIDGDWPNFWNIKVEKVVPAGKAGNQAMAGFAPVKEFTNTQDFLDWFGPICKEFDRIQEKAMEDDVRMSELVLCKMCNRTSQKCICMQAHPEQLPEGVAWGDPFKEEYRDGDRLELKVYECIQGNYICTTTISNRGKLLREFVAPMRIKQNVQAKPSAVEYALIFDEVVRRQRDNEVSQSGKFVAGVISQFLGLYVKYSVVRDVSHWLLNWSFVRNVIRYMVRNYVPPSKLAKHFFVFVGLLCERTINSPRWRKILLGLGAVAASWITYKRLSSWSVQGSTMSVPDTHFKKTEKENVWKRDDYETTTFDVDPMSLNYATLSPEKIEQSIRKNTARIFVEDGVKMIPGNAFCIGGHLWVTNNHILPESGSLKIDFRVDVPAQGASRNVAFKLDQQSIFREPDSDLAYFEILAVDARSDLSRLISRDTLEGVHDARYVGLNRDCSPRSTPVKHVVKTVNHCAALDCVFTYWRGAVKEDTVNGDCGTPLVSFSPAVVVLGLHQLGGSNTTVFAVKLSQESVVRAKAHFARPAIQAGVPRTSSELVRKTLGPLHHKSPLRWLEAGSITVFGSFLGYQVRSRSKVCATLCGEAIRIARSWEIPFGKPDLKDWRPWHLAYKDVINQENVLDASVLKQAVDGYVADVCSKLTGGDLENLRIISDHAAINGIAGVRYIDKMNFNSSMGEPFCKSKKHFLLPAPTTDQPDAKVFNEEVMERTVEIEKRYKAGIRACPVFSGQLKDEPRSHAKIAAGKIRVFTGAPVDWSFVVRKYLLSFVKVVQENQLLFEAAPGCVTQSLQWEQFRDYLVVHGEGQIVAGDYGKFDKKMTAQVILAAFDAIIGILRFAGWSMEDLLVVYGIAEDTAFPYVNFSGDLVMLYGSNPSGHPLTVIINSIVNALYMRYCYIELSADRECSTFKQFVSLLTYGDDNVMGVSPIVPWFNHTAIVGVLATIGVEYTMADKESVSIPYININDVSFLKRAWRYDDDVGAFLCPLEEQSIHKMLCIHIPSKTISTEAQMIASMQSAVREWFYYGKVRFEFERKFLLDVADEFFLDLPQAFPTWEELVDAFWRASDGMETKSLGKSYSYPGFPKPSVAIE